MGKTETCIKKVLSKIALYFLLILIAMLLLTLLSTACSTKSKDNGSLTKPTEDKEKETSIPEQETGKEDNRVINLPKDVYKISSTDTPAVMSLSYTIDPEDSAIIKSVRFEIKNFGASPIKPIVVFVVGDLSGSGSIKRFEYDELPAGYKMIKNEEVNIEVPSLHNPVYIKADVRDHLQGDKIIGSDQKNYIAKPAS